MTLTTHIAIAAAITKPFIKQHPILAFFVAIASHYLSDAIPHWDYRLGSLAGGENPDKREWQFKTHTFWEDFSRFAFDGFLGAGIAFLIIRPASLHEFFLWSLVVIGSCLPDFLQGVYYTRKAEFLKPLSHFHNRIHSKIKLGPYPLIGVPFQLIILFISLYFLT